MRRNDKIYPYIVVLKNVQAARIRLISTLMSVCGILMLVYRGIGGDGSRMNLMVAAIAAILTGWNIVASRKGRKVWYRIPLLVIALGLIALSPFHWAGILFIAMALLEKPASKPVEIGFADEHIRFNGLTNKDHAWNELQGVILKDGVLTMDFKSNKVLQLETDDEEDDDYDAEEQEFNDWVRAKLSIS
jgi:hypothetical protein